MRFLRVDKSKDLTSCRIQFPEGYVFPPAHLMGKLTACKHNGLQGKNALSIVILKKITHSKGHFIFSSFLTSLALDLLSTSLFTTDHSVRAVTEY